MGVEQYKNIAASTTTASVNNSSNPVTFSVQSGDGALFPVTTNGPFRVTLSAADGTNAEPMLCTSRTGDSLTCSRGSSATGEVPTPTLLAQSSGAIVSHDFTSGALNAIRSEICSFGTTASLPSTAGRHAGDRYVPTDSLIEEYICDGSLWQPFVRGLNVITPAIADFGTSVVSGGITVNSWANVNGGVYLSVKKASGTDNLAMKLKTFTAGKKYTMRFYTNVPGITTNPWLGIAARDSGSSKVYTWGVGYLAGGYQLWGGHWNSESSYAANDFQPTMNCPIVWRGPVSVRFTDDGSNYLLEAAPDGVNFETYFSVAHGSAFLTPNQIGVFALPYHATLSTALTCCDFFQT